MLDEPRRRRRAPDLETNTAPDLLHGDLRRRDQRETPPTRCRPTMSGKAKSRPAAALRRKVMAATTNIRSAMRIRRPPARIDWTGEFARMLQHCRF
jgi:hypothetical protein